MYKCVEIDRKLEGALPLMENCYYLSLLATPGGQSLRIHSLADKKNTCLYSEGAPWLLNRDDDR